MLNNWPPQPGRFLATGLVVTSFAFAGCASSADDSSTATTAVTSAGVNISTTSISTTSMSVADSAPTSAQSPVEPARPYESVPPTDTDAASTSAWISRRSMSAERIELQWTAPPGAAEYQIHRLPNTSDEQPESDEMTTENRIHVGELSGTVADEDVVSGTRYWYGIRGVAADGAILSSGWHRADAVTDDEPPASVGDLRANITDEGALVAWTAPDDNYELSSYLVSRRIDDGELEVIVAIYNADQTSVLDDQLPTTGTATYSVVARDFHWNDSIPATVTVDR